ncbi:MAG: Spy/CpxP family protein refolding chaperone [Sulfuriferula sp.]
MKKDTLTILMTTLLAGMLEVSFAYAKPSADGAERTGICTHAYQHTRKAQIYRLGKRLGLTQDQRTSVRAIVDQHRPEMHALQAAQQKSQNQLTELTALGGSDTKAVRTLADRHGEIIADMIVLRVQMRNEINRILTVEQRNKLLRAREIRKYRPRNEQGAELSGAQLDETAAHHLTLLIEAHRSVL